MKAVPRASSSSNNQSAVRSDRFVTTRIGVSRSRCLEGTECQSWSWCQPRAGSQVAPLGSWSSSRFSETHGRNPGTRPESASRFAWPDGRCPHRHLWLDDATALLWWRIDELVEDPGPYAFRGLLKFLQHVPERARAEEMLPRIWDMLLCVLGTRQPDPAMLCRSGSTTLHGATAVEKSNVPSGI